VFWKGCFQWTSFLVKAQSVFQDKVAGVGFDWKNLNRYGKKLQRNFEEFQEEVKEWKCGFAMEAEFGGCLFSYGKITHVF